MHVRHALAVVAVALAFAGLACGGGASSPSSTGTAAQTSKPVDPNGPETSPPGDIPDNQAFVRYSPPGAGFSIEVPEGWSRTTDGKAVVFTDKLNSIRIESRRAASPPAKKQTKSFVQSKPDAVTGKSRILAVERHVFWHNGREAIITLSSAKGADNVDPWNKVTRSLRWNA
jgi:hypothetical protein